MEVIITVFHQEDCKTSQSAQDKEYEDEYDK